MSDLIGTGSFVFFYLVTVLWLRRVSHRRFLRKLAAERRGMTEDAAWWGTYLSPADDLIDISSINQDLLIYGVAYEQVYAGVRTRLDPATIVVHTRGTT